MYTMFATIMTKGTYVICFYPPCLKIYSRELLALVSGKGTEVWAPLKPQEQGIPDWERKQDRPAPPHTSGHIRDPAHDC